MGVREGYKQTEVGIIPEDWRVEPLGSVLGEFPRYGINAPASGFIDSLPRYIRITDITEDGHFSEESPVSVNHSMSSSYFVSQNDILLARTGASVGKSYIHRDIATPLVYAGFLIKIKVDSKKASADYVASYLKTGSYWQWVKVTSQRSGQPGINGQEYARLPVPLPPLPEQKAIAAALSDADELIAGLEALVAKKRAIKQGAMQQLLTGRKRLPGFVGGCAGTVGDLIDLAPQRKRHTPQLAYVFIGMEDVSESGGLLNQHIIRPDEIRSGLTYFEREDVLVAKITPCFENGKGANLRGMNQFSGFGSTEFHVLRANSESDQVYLFFQTQMSEFRQKLADEMVGSAGHKRVPFKAVLNYPLPIVPPLPEQQAIAAVLSDVDAEIESLQTQLGKTRALKQGMMQELLTGRIRLV
ncbi:restriction endonuclease subunit S [Deinococcus sp.]|uniref:restriction endonuclease subunit S n=1 Tax=Deinococcus sp. TaxID=47478 RepID=UPI003C7B87AE